MKMFYHNNDKKCGILWSFVVTLWSFVVTFSFFSLFSFLTPIIILILFMFFSFRCLNNQISRRKNSNFTIIFFMVYIYYTFYFFLKINVSSKKNAFFWGLTKIKGKMRFLRFYPPKSVFLRFFLRGGEIFLLFFFEFIKFFFIFKKIFLYFYFFFSFFSIKLFL